ncbi:MAG TPA: hypothetical protein VF857_02565 [Spirochaetota bacterium]
MKEPEDKTNYYIEPVDIEIYLKKAGTIKTIVKSLYIELFDEEPKPQFAKKLFGYFREIGSPIDLIEAQNVFPESILPFNNSYYQYEHLYNKLNFHIQSGLSGSIDSWRQSIYLTELLMKYEPTIASLEFFGDFHTFNLHYIIRTLNKLGHHVLLEDTTVAYLIKRARKFRGEGEIDPEWEKLVELWEYNLKEKIIF